MKNNHLEKSYNVVLGAGMLVLGIIMFGFFLKDVWQLAQLLWTANLTDNFYAITRLILETFLFFEFVVLTQEYFLKNHISLENFMYIGITAMLRNLLVYHDDTIGILIQSVAIGLMILVLIAYRWSRRHLADLEHQEERTEYIFAEEHAISKKIDND
ncbi:phosphate-starvation-inducible PsiE family protein [Weissella bombi]|uniref:Protein PsiE n=1 Tax=Weissella bombi TaxID=1505725 RepID=A0A1C3ZWN7_9LACO|nr:phosphate-starvation-inducible PsiE family protein [Weissella bombi]SCB86753.1 protein PsiE [Weissella bombi]